MRDWLSATDLAALRLPGLPGTPNGWRDYAEREGWLLSASRSAPGQPLAGKVRVREGRGGGLEFHIDLLPAAWRAAYVAQHIGRVAAPDDDLNAAAREGDAALAADSAPLAALEARDARLALLAAADRLMKGGNLSRGAADAQFVLAFQRGDIGDSWIREAVPKLSVPTLARWRRHKLREGAARLGVDKGAARRGKGLLESAEDGKVKRLVLGLRAMNTHLSADHIKEKIEHDFPHLAGRFSLRNVQRLVARIEAEDKVALLQIRNPDKARSYHRLTGGTNAPVSRLNEMWQIDASPADVLCVDGRHSIYACVDIWSRRQIIYVSKTPRAEAVCLLMRRAILAWGAPEIVKTDNGSDFKAKATQRLFAALEIEVDVSAPYQPQQKGHVERAIRTFQHDCATLLPGFVGHNVKDRKALEERKAFAQRLGLDDAGAFKVELTAIELQSICDDWAAGRYEKKRVHSALGCTPFEQAARFTGAVRRIDDVRALDLLLAPIAEGGGVRTVTKRGVRIDHSFYLTPVLPETRVFVRMDPQDMGRCWLFSEDGAAFLGEAICPELAGVDPVAALMEARAQRKALLDDKLAEARAEMRKIKPRDMIDAVIRKPLIDAGRLVEFPKRAEVYTTPGLEAARAALDEESVVRSGPAQPLANDEPAINYFVEPSVSRSGPAQPPAPVVQLAETPQMRFRRARDLEARLANNERLDTGEALWLGGYQQSNEYRALKEIHDDADDAAAAR